MNAQEKKEMKTRDREKEQKMEELKEEEIRGILKKMKNKKAMNIDGNVEICKKYIIEGHDGIFFIRTSLETRRDT